MTRPSLDDDPWQNVASETERDYFSRLRARRILPLELATCVVAGFIILASLIDSSRTPQNAVDRITTSSTIGHCDDSVHRYRDC